MGQLVSKRVLSEIVGVSERTLSDWQEKGMPIKVHTTRGFANEYDTADVFNWRVNYVAGGEKTESAKERKERLEGDRLELILAKEAGEFLMVEDVEYAMASAFASARAEFMASARKLKTKLKQEYKIDVELEWLNDHVRSTLTKLAEHTPEFSKDDGEGVEEVGSTLTDQAD